ncbi:dienelactone hydrolase family protein [Streptomyces sp. Ru87]|uniref:dienelactone hydrolase family protein n=1 Tax=Streptomyces sp. Ru87 TaxID=2044307 RepID=UPI000BF454EF|nr:dienelactone hydrolase family protein [Streptomyces sp. Ru87]PGH48707.1 dienelactone hydrolase [Streptomyces sp. Ru87]
MESENVTIQTQDGPCDAFAAYPETDGTYPAVLLFMDAFGVRPVLRDMARRLAAEGYYVLVPNLFHRNGPAPVVELPDLGVPEAREAFFREAGPLMRALTPELAMRDADRYLAFLASRPQVAPGPAGTVGYCMGGALAVRTAARHPERIAAAASFHGGHLVTEEADSPHRLLGQVDAELYFGHADQDHAMDARHIARLEEALDAAGVTYHSEVYEGAAHGFTMADTPVFDAAALDRHWERLLDLFARTLRG